MLDFTVAARYPSRNWVNALIAIEWFTLYGKGHSFQKIYGTPRIIVF